ncbi:hypothetical protein EVG20_g9244 [Dentipellis fragilis]|uniref:Palmitoyltransferase n=1 Tax=Dentipellis fragilis TaxID=205917 RepID=A0A4Y9XZX5_9AGAM|nr:hypothetical protein EVG20_g9244 [Dentipellis fragilis]
MDLGQPLRSGSFDSPGDDDEDSNVAKRWYHYIPVSLAVVFLLAPQPSILYVLLHYHLLVLQSTVFFSTHLLMTYTLTFLAFCSLIACISRDPGPVPDPKQSEENDNGGEMSLTEALMGPPPEDEDYTKPGKWCRVCWAPKPERSHHCSQCGRCVLKMDHHCIWMANKCIGHRTYPSFIHFLGSATFLALYVAAVNIQALTFAFRNPLSIDELTPVHELFLSFYCLVFAIVIGPFFVYHLYLVSTNQTTVESLSPFLLLRQLPPISPENLTRKFSDPPAEHELSYQQRRLVKDAGNTMHLYDLGWRKNWAQVFGPVRVPCRVWLARILWGGSSPGDGMKFPRNPKSDDMLARLATELIKADRQD